MTNYSRSVLKSNGLHRPKIRLKKFSFSLKIVPAYIFKKLPSQCWPKPLFIAFFNFSHKRPTFAFTGEIGYTLVFRRKIAHKGTHGETGAFRTGVVSLPSERSARSPTSPGRVSERQVLPLLGLGRGCSQRTQKAFGTVMRLCASLFRRRRGPAGLRDLFATWLCCCFFTLCAVLSERARWGWYHYHRRALRAAETPDGRLSKWFICRFPGSLSTIPCAVTFSANMQISLSVISVANAFALWYDKSHKSGLFGDEGEPE